MASIQSSIQLFDNASPVLRSMSNALNVCISSFESMQYASKSGVDTSSIKLARDELAKVETNINDIEDKIEQAKKQQDRFNGSIKNGSDAVKGLKSGFMKIASVIGGAIGLNQIMKVSDEMVSISARLDMIKSKNESVEDVQKKIFASAQRSRGSYQDTADAIGKMGIMAKDSFSSTDELVAFMEQVNKQFVIAGTSAEGQKASMLQLTQAMASGVLRGEELNSVFEQAPTIIQSIAEYMGKPIGEIRNLAKEGQLTADVVKNAMFYTAEQTNKKFEDMPKTFAQIKTAMANEAQMAFQPVLQQLNKLMNDEKFTKFTNRLLNGIVNVANFTTTAFNSLIGLADLVANNWSYVEPIIVGVTTALLIYKGVAIATSVANGVLALSESIKSAKTAMATGSTFLATVQQYGFNASLYACPLTWYIAMLIGVIAVLAVLCNWIAKTTKTADSGLGVFLGSFIAMLAFSANIFIGFINSVIQALNYLISPFVSIIEWIVNAFNGGFDNIGDALLNLLGKMINHFLSFAKIITPIIDAVFGTEWTKKIDNLKTNINNWGKNDKAKTYKVEIPTIDRFEYKDAFKVGAEWGDKIASKFGFKKTTEEDYTEQVKNELDNLYSPYSDTLNGILNNTGNTANDTSKLTDSMEWLDEDIKYLNDIAEREAINKFTTAEIKVDLTNNNSISSKVDVDDFMTKFNENLIEVLQTASEGVH